MTPPRPFRSETTEEQLADLRGRLAGTRFAPALSGTDWTHGTPPGYLAELVDYWRNEYDWSAAERQLNELPQFLAEVDGNTLRTAGLTDYHLEEIEVRRTVLRRQDVDLVDATS
jgi:hypothetical protein